MTSSDLSPAAAVQLILSGDAESGFAAYRHAIHERRWHAPLGIHARMLASAGRPDYADRLLSMALRNGGDLAVAPFMPGTTPLQAAEEYESLFDRGLINSWMVARYLLVLDQLGRSDTIRELLDPERVLRFVRLADRQMPDGTPLAAAVESAVLDHAESSKFEEAVQSVRRMRKLSAVNEIRDPRFEALCAVMREEVQRWLDERPASAHVVSRWVPREFELEMWALISDGSGSNSRHVHSRGWSTGVYYATGVDSCPGDAGALRIGRPKSVAADAPGWPDLTIHPEPGLLVLMPSYMTHWVEPIGRPLRRISLPFDVVDSRELSDAERLD